VYFIQPHSFQEWICLEVTGTTGLYLARYCIIKSAAAALRFQWIRQAPVACPIEMRLGEVPLKDSTNVVITPWFYRTTITARGEPLTLMLILKMGQEAFHLHFCLWRQSIIILWQCATCHPPDYPWYMTNNRWCCVDAPFHDGAGMVLLSVLPIKAAKNSVVTDYNLSEVLFPRTHDQT
jgi:hypothetical protein